MLRLSYFLKFGRETTGSGCLVQLLKEIQSFDLNEQENIFRRKIDEWKGKQVQIDDFLIIGVKIKGCVDGKKVLRI